MLATMIYSASALRFSLVCCFIQIGLGNGFGVDSGIFSNVKDLLIGFNSPLKLTIVSCWDAEKTVQLMGHITNGPKNFQIKIVNDTNGIGPILFERHLEVILVDLHCDNAANIFDKMDRHLFNLYRIIVFDSSSSKKQNNSVPNIDTKLKLSLGNYPFMPMSQVFFIFKDFVKDKLTVKQVYRTGMGQPLVIEEFALSDVETSALTPVLRRRNLQGFQFKASMVILDNNSLNHLDDYRDNHIDAISRVGYRLTNHLMSFVNATVKYSIVSTWGYKNQTTGKWNGLVGDLLSNEADVGATPMFFTTDRVSMLEYISRPTSATGGFVFRAPKLSYTNNLYVLPFDRLLWLCLVALVIVIAVFLCGAVMIELKVFTGLEKTCRISDVYMIVYGAVCQQGSSTTPNSVTGRMIMAIAFIILMFLYVSYSANIVALLQSPSNQIKTLHDLYESKLDAFVQDTVYNRYYFPLFTETLRKKFYDEKLSNKDGKFVKLATLEDGMKKLREGQVAFHTEYSSAYKIISETFLDVEKCGLQEISFFQMKVDPWYVIQKNSSYKEILKIGMMRIQEHGLQQKENLRYFTTKPKCLSGGGNFVSASLIDTGPAIMLLVWGTAITLVIFISELIFAKFKFVSEKLSTMLTKFRFTEQ